MVSTCYYSSHCGDSVFSMAGPVSSEDEKDQVKVMMDGVSD